MLAFTIGVFPEASKGSGDLWRNAAENLCRSSTARADRQFNLERFRALRDAEYDDRGVIFERVSPAVFDGL